MNSVSKIMQLTDNCMNASDTNLIACRRMLRKQRMPKLQNSRLTSWKRRRKRLGLQLPKRLRRIRRRLRRKNPRLLQNLMIPNQLVQIPTSAQISKPNCLLMLLEHIRLRSSNHLLDKSVSKILRSIWKRLGINIPNPKES